DPSHGPSTRSGCLPSRTSPRHRRRARPTLETARWFPIAVCSYTLLHRGIDNLSWLAFQRLSNAAGGGSRGGPMPNSYSRMFLLVNLPGPRFADLENPGARRIDVATMDLSEQTLRQFLGGFVREIESPPVDAEQRAGIEIHERLHRFLGLEMHEFHHFGW